MKGQYERDPVKTLLSKIKHNGECWEWTGKLKPNGYGQFTINKKYVHVHRFSYEHHIGPIPSGLVIDHLCRNRACVNPNHLEAVPQRVNVLRGKGFPAGKAQQTHCIRGHLFDENNTYVRPNGTRNCKTCRRDQKRQ